MKEIIDIHYFKGIGLEKKLSNLYPYTFIIDGISMQSFEGFLQSLKCPNIDDRKEFWNMYGVEAWKKGQRFNNWKDRQILYWNDKEIDRHSKEYDDLISRAYDCLFTNEDFKKTLEQSLDYDIDHNGKTNKSDSVLTKKEYIDNLNRLRDKVKPPKFYNLFDL